MSYLVFAATAAGTTFLSVIVIVALVIWLMSKMGDEKSEGGTPVVVTRKVCNSCGSYVSFDDSRCHCGNRLR